MVFPVITFCLGSWQLYRLKWKLDLIDKMEQKKKLEVIDLPKNVSEEDMKELEYRKVKLRGEFVNEREMFLGPKTKEGHYGFHLIVPFKRKEDGKYVVVNRGFVPREFKEQKSRLGGMVVGETDLVAVARKIPAKTSNNSENNREKEDRFYYSVEPAKMIPEQPDAVYVEEVEVEPSKKMKTKFPMGGATNFQLRNNHLEYTLTWYGTTIALLFFMFKTKVQKGAGADAIAKIKNLQKMRK